MILTTRGAKSRQPRTTVVTYTRDGDRYVIAASNSGAPSHPAWYFNIRSTPTVTVEVRGETFEAVGTITTSDERDRLWRQHAAERPEFRAYPSMTNRVIPMISLERTA
ncbi:MAG: nitroreductase family deazaflavin-dependent oxidoreductase [Chloroflexota bacterium]|nr:nitroreductase family deazaflavin-dependent oxidoreductase [Chloroflexota bacterium]